ncbi:MAG: hypothetical protein ACHQ52_01855 [Candidatus Eisenbacteria bacterium]
MRRRWILVIGVAFGVVLGVSLTNLGCPGSTTSSRFLTDVRLPELVLTSLPSSAHDRARATSGGQPVYERVPGGKVGRVDVVLRIPLDRDEQVRWVTRLKDLLLSSLETSGAKVVATTSAPSADLPGLEGFDIGYRAGLARGWIVVESVLGSDGNATLTLHVREMPR